MTNRQKQVRRSRQGGLLDGARRENASQFSPPRPRTTTDRSQESVFAATTYRCIERTADPIWVTRRYDVGRGKASRAMAKMFVT